MMNWGSLKWLLDNMTAEQLQEPARVYSPYFERVYEIQAMDNLTNVAKNMKGDEIVIAMKAEPVR